MMTDDKRWEIIREINANCETAEDRGRFLASLLESEYNSFSTKAMTKAACDQLTVYTHKTIQQSIMNGVIQYLKAVSETESIDGRNEHAVKAAKIAYTALYNAGYDVLPMI